MLKNWKVSASVAILMIAAILFAQVFIASEAGSTVRINDTTIRVGVARTSEQQAKGLSYMDNLSADEGLIFIYNQPRYHSFWMKDMKFPIDIVWIGPDKRVVDITANISPNTYPETFSSTQLTQYVLEVNAGFAKTNKIEKGDKVRIDIH